MMSLNRLKSRLIAIIRKRSLDADMEEEMRSHIEMLTRENVQAGMEPAEARFAAMRQFGWKESIKQECREQRGVTWLENLWQDIRFSLRQLRRDTGFSVVAVLMLALGIGLNTAVFGVAKAAFFRPLGFANEDRLMWIRFRNTQTDGTEDRLSWKDYEDLQESSRSFESLALFGSPGATLEHEDRTEELPALQVSANLGEVLRVKPVLGRMFLASDSVPTASAVTLIGYEMWQNRYGGTPDVLGRTVRLNGKVHEIIGVLPPGLQFPLERTPAVGTGSNVSAGVQSFWFPLAMQGEDLTNRNNRMNLAVGRLKAGIGEEEAQAELKVIGERLSAAHLETNRWLRFELLSFRDQILGHSRQAIPILVGAVVAVLLICCVNLTNLLLARGMKRQRETAVRVALGSGRWRLARGLIVESLLLAFAGGALGMLLAHGTFLAIRSQSASDLPLIREARLDSATTLFTLSLSLMAPLLFACLPLLRQSQCDAGDVLRTGVRSTGGYGVRAWQRGLLTFQIAAVLALLSAAGMLLESFRRLMGQDLGYKPHSVIAVDISTHQLPTNDDGVRFYREIESRLSAIPGVEAVGTVQSTPLTGKWIFTEKTAVFGHPRPAADLPSLAATFVAFDYFQVMGIPLLEGRVFRKEELHDDRMPPVVVLNEAAVAALFPGESGLGKRVAFGSTPGDFYEVVGVVKDTREVRLEQKGEPRFYKCFAFGGAQFVVKSSIPEQAATQMIRDTLKQFGSKVVIHDVRPLTEIISSTVAERRMLVSMLSVYAALACVIAMIGVFGVVSYHVAHRTHEFGVRLALGSSPAGLLRLVMMQAARLVCGGLVIGLVLSLATGKLIANQLFGVEPHDPVLLGGFCVLLFFITLGAGYLPARRAGRVNPMVALRAE